MTAKQSDRSKSANVLGCTLWGSRSSPYAGPRTNPFARGILKGANVLGLNAWGERSSPFANKRENPFARSPAPAVKSASSSEGGVDGMAAAMESMLEGSIDPTRGFSMKTRERVAGVLGRS